MNEPPGARLRIGLAGLTTAEYFRDRGQDVLLFIDNIFRFSQAGSEVSALLGRMPVSYTHLDVYKRQEGGHSSNPYGGTSLEVLSRAITAICDIEWPTRRCV